jgi:ubiquinone/menaquinone biosynthesis C-methylase UbiE
MVKRHLDKAFAPNAIRSGKRMPLNPRKAVQIQRQYYTDTAARYDSMHAHEGDDDPGILKFVWAMLRTIEAQTVLDVGAGTGRGIRHLLDAIPGLSVRGIEPVAALIQQAVQKNRVPPGAILQGSGDALPFADASFDVVCSFALLHHVPKPDAVVREMVRVARKAVIIADSNRFGQGAWPVRLAKLGLYKTGLWGAVNFLKTGGKGYMITEGDGLAYSYSVYDSLDRITQWAEQVILIPAEPGKSSSWFHPLLTSSGIIVCALKEPA